MRYAEPDAPLLPFAMRWTGMTLFLIALECGAVSDSIRSTMHPKQGLVDMLYEYLLVRYAGVDLSGDVLYVSMERQAMYHARGGMLLKEYPVSTANNGPGSHQNSYCTPTGLHRISEKFGDGIPPYGILRDRVFTGEIADPDFAGVDKDRITSRVLWLDGLEPGHNNGGEVDSHDRFIYIHGTANERSIGTPRSRGCIRMGNADVIELYELVNIGTLVIVLDN